jgi:DNA-binding transcriptional LysR family regulator
VRRDPIIVAMPRRHRLAARRHVRLAALADEPFIVFPARPRPSWADVIVALGRRAGFEPRLGHEAIEMASALSLVAAGIGVTLVPSSVRAVRRPGVVFRPLTPPAPVSELLVVRRDEPPSAVLARFLEVVAGHAQHDKR